MKMATNSKDNEEKVKLFQQIWSAINSKDNKENFNKQESSKAEIKENMRSLFRPNHKKRENVKDLKNESKKQCELFNLFYLILIYLQFDFKAKVSLRTCLYYQVIIKVFPVIKVNYMSKIEY